MKISTIAQNKHKIIPIIVILILWQVMSKIYSPIIVPPIKDVIVALGNIFTGKEFLVDMMLTVKRLIIALTISLSLGVVLGIVSGYSLRFKQLIMPFINIMQAVPPISWLVLALIWFGLDGKASIFIAVIATLPIIIINLIEGINNIDNKLIEMGRMYRFSKGKMIRRIIIPSIIPYFEAGLKIIIGSGCKIIVMGEVLSTTNGIGGQITNARLNIQTEYIFAWTIIIVLLFYMINMILSYIFDKKIKGERYAYKNTRFN